MTQVLVLFAEGSEELETVTIVNILRRAGINTTLAGLSHGTLRAARGIYIQPDRTLDDVIEHSFDMLVLPGGQPGTNHLKADQRVLTLIRNMVAQSKPVAAICAAPSVLAEAGVLTQRRATCYPTCLNAYPDVQIQTSAIEEDGNLITSRGPGTALDFALYLVQRLLGEDQRKEVEASLVR